MLLGDSKEKHALTTGISNKALASALSTLFLHLWSIFKVLRSFSGK